MTTLRVLGIDPGLATTGWGMVEGVPGKTPRHLSSGAILTSPKLPLIERLLRISQNLQSLIETHRPEHMCVEELFFVKHSQSIAATAQARGAILLAAAQNGLKVYEYNPRAVKMAVTGYGSADKAQIQQMIQRLLSLKEIPKPDDTADALAIAVCHMHSLRISEAVAP